MENLLEIANAIEEHANSQMPLIHKRTGWIEAKTGWKVEHNRGGTTALIDIGHFISGERVHHDDYHEAQFFKEGEKFAEIIDASVKAGTRHYDGYKGTVHVRFIYETDEVGKGKNKYFDLHKPTIKVEVSYPKQCLTRSLMEVGMLEALMDAITTALGAEELASALKG